MQMQMIKKILFNQYTWIAVIVIIIIVNYNIKLLKQESLYNDKVSEYNSLNKQCIQLTGQYNELELDLDSTIKTNDENIRIIQQYKSDFDKMVEIINIQQESKESEIKILTDTIEQLQNLPVPGYNGVVSVDQCVVKITNGGNLNAKKKLKALSNIGN